MGATMTPITKSQRLEIQALAAAATPGPWRNGYDPSHFDAAEVTDGKTFAYYVVNDNDASFIAAARAAIPAYEAALVEAEAERDEALGEISRMTMRPAAEIIESERHRAGLLDRMQAERDALAAKLAAMTAARDEATARLDALNVCMVDNPACDCPARCERVADLRNVGKESK